MPFQSFQISEIDCFGPLKVPIMDRVKMVKMALFRCSAVLAIPLEVIEDLMANSYIAAIADLHRCTKLQLNLFRTPHFFSTKP